MADSDALDGQLAEARYLGADAALACASCCVMSEGDAHSLLTDVDPEVVDRYPEPNLAGEMAGDPTPHSVAGDVLGTCSCADGHVACDEDYSDVESQLADAWEQGRDHVWSDALQAVALRTLGHIRGADRIERHLDAHVALLRHQTWRGATDADAAVEVM